MERLLFYCTKAKPYITYDSYDKRVWNTDLSELMLNGKIVVECEYDLVEVIKYASYDCTYYTNTIDTFGLPPLLLQKSCLDHDALDEYLKEDNGYAIYLKNVKVFDEPKELGECEMQVSEIDYDTLSCDSCTMLKKDCKECYYNYRELRKAPQNMCYVGFKGQKYILIPIKSQYLVHILNGEKTIEVRRKILNALKELIK